MRSFVFRGGRAPSVTWFAAFAISATVLFAPPALAQKTDADRLFDEGTELMKENKYAEACAKFAESNRLDPEVGGLLWLADCYARNGQTASAFKTYKAAQKMALDRKDKKHRESVAQRHMDEIEPHLTKLTVVLPKEARPDGLVVTVVRDGQKLEDTDFGVPIPVDPGTYTITAKAPNYDPWEQKVEANGDGQSATVTVGPMVKSDGSSSSSSSASSSSSSPSGSSTSPGKSDLRSTFRIGGIIAGAVGLAALGVGTGFGLLASSRLGDSNSNNHCDAADTCDSLGLQLRAAAKNDALASTIFFIGGGVALAAGITLFLIAPHQKHAASPAAFVAPAIGGGFYGASFAATF